MSKWLRIDEVVPEIGQKVFYYFGFFDKVYPGIYEGGEEHVSHIFVDAGGFLGDDVTYWMPREEGPDFPELVPGGGTFIWKDEEGHLYTAALPDLSPEEKEKDHYHPRDEIGLFMYDCEGDPNVRLHWVEGEGWK